MLQEAQKKKGRLMRRRDNYLNLFDFVIAAMAASIKNI